MKQVLLDTNAYSALRRGDTAVLDALCHAEIVLMSAIVLGELNFGFRRGDRYARNSDDLRKFLDHPMVELAPVTNDTAEVYGIVYQRLQEAGTPIPLNDVWVATQCLEHGALLITYDQHFELVAGLQIWQPMLDL